MKKRGSRHPALRGLSVNPGSRKQRGGEGIATAGTGRQQNIARLGTSTTCGCGSASGIRRRRRGLHREQWVTDHEPTELYCGHQPSLGAGWEQRRSILSVRASGKRRISPDGSGHPEFWREGGLQRLPDKAGSIVELGNQPLFCRLGAESPTPCFVH